MAIVQPRLDWIDEWEISLTDLLTWANEVVEPAAAEALTVTAHFKSGEWCTKNFCKIRASCRTRADEVKAGLLDEMGEVTDGNELDEDELGKAMSLVPLVKKWAADIEGRVTELTLAGHEIVGSDGLAFKMVAGRGSRNWDDQAVAEKALRNYKVKVGDIWTRKFCTPAGSELPDRGPAMPTLISA